jgi:predicted  nucleic acid-binding Zn-ribbon protein
MTSEHGKVIGIESAEIRLVSRRIRDIAKRLEAVQNTEDMDGVKAELTRCLRKLDHLNQRLRRLDPTSGGLDRDREVAKARLKPYLGL